MNKVRSGGELFADADAATSLFCWFYEHFSALRSIGLLARLLRGGRPILCFSESSRRTGMKKILVLAASVVMLLASTRPASAITFTNFSPQGSWALVDNGAVGGFESLTLYYDPTGYVDGGGNVDYISSVAIKVTSSIGATSGLNSTTAPGTWASTLGGLSNGGCNGSGSGFDCAQTLSTLGLTTNAWSWTFYLDLAGNALSTGTDGASIKAQFLDSPTSNGNILSQGITLQGSGGTDGGSGSPAIPEPASLMLLGSGLAFAATRLRNRRK